MKLLKKLVETYSPSHDEDNAVQFFINQLKQLGFDTSIDEVGNAIGKIGNGNLNIYLIGHIDTVPGNLPVILKDGKLFGRGSVDAKGCLCAFAEAASKFKESKDLSLTVIGCVREESDSAGAYHILKNLPSPDFVIIGEPSGWDGITIGYRGVMWLEYNFESSRHHHGAPEPTPAEVGVKFYNKILNEFANEYPSFDTPSLRLVKMKTYQKLGNVGIDMKMDLRTPINFDFDHFLDFCNSNLKNASLTHDEPISAVLTGKRNALVSSLLGGIRSHNGKPKFKKKTGSADMNILAEWGCPIVAYGPGDSSLDHTSEEHILVSEYEKSISILINSLKRIY